MAFFEPRKIMYLIINRLVIYHHDNNLKKAIISRILTKMGVLSCNVG
jgi:hypothetical protein